MWLNWPNDQAGARSQLSVTCNIKQSGSPVSIWKTKVVSNSGQNDECDRLFPTFSPNVYSELSFRRWNRVYSEEGCLLVTNPEILCSDTLHLALSKGSKFMHSFSKSVIYLFSGVKQFSPIQSCSSFSLTEKLSLFILKFLFPQPLYFYSTHLRYLWMFPYCQLFIWFFWCEFNKNFSVSISIHHCMERASTLNGRELLHSALQCLHY